MSEIEKEPNPSGYLLPVISPEIANGINATIEEQGDEDYMKKAFERIRATNPVLLDAITDTGETEDLSDREMTILINAVVVTHDILHKQAEADALKHSVA